MNVIVTGATGMVGAGALREALADSDVDAVLSISRRSCGVSHPKLRELLLPDLFDFADVESDLRGWDACIWAVGISSMGLDERAYARVTEELTLKWARVRRRVEDGIEALPFRHAGCVRAGFIQPGPGIRSTVRFYQTLIVVFRPLLPVLVKMLPAFATTSERLGRAMLRVVQGRADCFILESAEINRIGATASP